MSETNPQNWLCPDLSCHWQLKRSRVQRYWVLQGLHGAGQISFDALEGYALAHFSGSLTIAQVQRQCQQKFGDRVPADFVWQLLQKLVTLGVLMPEARTSGTSGASRASEPTPVESSTHSLRLKPGVQWSQPHDGHWILADPEGLRHLQVSPDDKAVIDWIGSVSPAEIPQRCGCSPAKVQQLLNLLAQGQMLHGIEPPKPPKRKFTPMQLLYFKKSLWNPDQWLGQHVGRFSWLWQRPMAWLLCGFLGLSAVFAVAQRLEIWLWGQMLLQTYGWQLLLPFGVLSMAVVSLHELAHAFTLKHFGGKVPEVGLLFMCLMPAAYTNSSDSYRLNQWQRCLVIGAGVLCQIVIAAIAFWLWFATSSSSALHTAAYLLMVAALFTVALNLNPLARFDGYYLLAAITGINNLKGRSFGLYATWLRGLPTLESGRDRWILAAYAPLSFGYLLLVFGRLFLGLANLILTHVPYLILSLFVLWLIYYLYPQQTSHDRISPTSK